MAKHKLERFAEMEGFRNVVQPTFDEAFAKSHPLRGNWASTFFQNNNPLVLELGCGKGEYTLGLARNYKNSSFLGVDIKGARIWRGAKTATEENITNVGFLRCRIEMIGNFFAPGEVSEIWITFPDPQLKNHRAKKRLTSARFLNAYRQFVKPGAVIHLKTDNEVLYKYTLNLIKHNQLPLLFATDNLYEQSVANEASSIQTFYENQYLAQGIPIKYIQFKLDSNHELSELPTDEESGE
jgi:tRNA (guanine-N7-)-methyltransferase